MAEIGESKITDITGGSELDKMDARAKAAVVVVSLGADRASQIYKYLSEQEIEDLTYEVAKLGKTNNTQVENALDEFYKMCLTHKMMTDGGLDYARSVLEKAFGETTARNLLEKVSKTLQSKPFNFFTKGDPKSLLALLQHERPQVIALIMAYMDPQQAAQILEQLPNEKRIPVLEGMANMSRVSPEAIAIVEEEMKRKFATIITSEDNMNLGGIDYVADVMNHVDRGNEKQIFDEMDKDNPELSKSIRDKSNSRVWRLDFTCLEFLVPTMTAPTLFWFKMYWVATLAMVTPWLSAMAFRTGSNFCIPSHPKESSMICMYFTWERVSGASYSLPM